MSGNPTSTSVPPVRLYAHVPFASTAAQGAFNQLMQSLGKSPMAQSGKTTTNSPWYEFVKTPEEANLLIEVDEDGALFERRDEVTGAFTMGPRVNAEHFDDVFPGVMQHVALFNYYLGLDYETRNVDVDVRLYTLEPSPAHGEFMIPGKEIPFAHNGSVEIPFEENELYAFVLHNNSDQELFPYVVWFDPTTYGTHIFYQPSTTNPPLQPKGKIQLGSSDECLPAMSLRPEQQSEKGSGFWKIILTSVHNSIDSMKLKPALGYDKTGQLNYFFVQDNEKAIDSIPRPLKGVCSSVLRKVTVLSSVSDLTTAEI